MHAHFRGRSVGLDREEANFERAAAEAFDSEPKVTGSGGTIPLLTTLQRLAPDAEFVIWGPGDEHSRVHAANESLDLGELERMIVAETLLLEKLGELRLEKRPAA